MASTEAPHQIHELIARALDVDAANLALGHETFQAEGATFVRNRAYPRIYDANHITHITASTPDEIDSLLTRVEHDYDGIGHRQFDVDFRTPPPFVARLVLEGYERRDALLMLLEGDLQGSNPEHEIRPLNRKPTGVSTDRLKNSTGGSTRNGSRRRPSRKSARRCSPSPA